MNGKPVFLRSRKAEELIALLACAGDSPMSKRACAGFLWPDAAENTALDSLRKLCSQIRSLNIPLAIVQEGGRISLSASGLYCDISEFVRLHRAGAPNDFRRALALYRGPLLFEEAYDWAAEFEAYYDVLYMELMDACGYTVKQL